MITRITGQTPFLWNPIASEASLRQCGQYAAYGPNCAFLRFYQDELGNQLSLFDGNAALHTSGDTSEMCLMLTMDPTVLGVRTDAKTAKQLAEKWGVDFDSEAVMTAPKNAESSPLVRDISLRKLYPVLSEGFAGSLPPFDVWYADAHHRFRRGLCRAVAVYESDQPVAVAMTVAECDKAALIGAVTTLPAARGKGYASACVLSLSHQLQKQNKTVFLSPKNVYAHSLYERIGFTVCGEWGYVRKA